LATLKGLRLSVAAKLPSTLCH